MIVDGLDGAKAEEEDGLTDGHERARVGNGRAECVEQEAFHRVVVKRAERVGYVEPMVDRVEVAVEEWDGVEEAMKKSCQVSMMKLVTARKTRSKHGSVSRTNHPRRSRRDLQRKQQLNRRNSPPIHPLDHVLSVAVDHVVGGTLSEEEYQ